MKNKINALVSIGLVLLLGCPSLILLANKESLPDSESSIPIKISIEADSSKEDPEPSIPSDPSTSDPTPKPAEKVSVIVTSQFETAFIGSDTLGIRPSEFKIVNQNKTSRLKIKNIKAVLKDPEWKFYQSDSIKDVTDHFSSLPLDSKEVFVGIYHTDNFRPINNKGTDPGISIYPNLSGSINSADLDLFIYIGGTSRPIDLHLVDLIFEFETVPLINDKVIDSLCEPYISPTRGKINPCMGDCAIETTTDACFTRSCGDVSCGPSGKSCCYNGDCQSVKLCERFKNATLTTYSKLNDASTVKLDRAITAINDFVFADHPEIKTIINTTGLSFDWGKITGSMVQESQIFVTGTIRHQYGDIRVIKG